MYIEVHWICTLLEHILIQQIWYDADQGISFDLENDLVRTQLHYKGELDKTPKYNIIKSFICK